MYETERTRDSVGKILWPGHLNVYQTRTNPKCSSISSAMLKILSIWAKAKDNNLKLEDNIPNSEQEKPHKMPEKESRQCFDGFISVVRFECSKPNCSSSTFLPLLLCHTSLILFFYFQILLLYFMSISYMYPYSLYWSNNFFAFYVRTKEQPHVMSSYSSCTSSLKLYQIQFVTLLIPRSPSCPVTFPSVIKLRKENGRIRVNPCQLVWAMLEHIFNDQK